MGLTVSLEDVAAVIRNLALVFQVAHMKLSAVEAVLENLRGRERELVEAALDRVVLERPELAPFVGEIRSRMR